MKLSKAQAQILEYAHKVIDEARDMEYPDWLYSKNHYYQIPKWMTDETSPYYNPEGAEFRRKQFEEAVAREEMKDYWQAYRDGKVLTHCNSKTLVKLESLGLIEIIYDSNGEYYGLDWIRVLNY